MRRDLQERARLRAGQLWAAYGRPPGCYSEFYFQAVRELALADDLTRISTEACLARLRATEGISRHGEPAARGKVG
jgi:hypothetical protein